MCFNHSAMSLKNKQFVAKNQCYIKHQELDNINIWLLFLLCAPSSVQKYECLYLPIQVLKNGD